MPANYKDMGDRIVGLVAQLNSIRESFMDSAKCFKSVQDDFKTISNAIGGSIDRIEVEGVTIPPEVSDEGFASELAKLRRKSSPILIMHSAMNTLDVLLKARDSLASKHKKLSDRNKEAAGSTKEERSVVSAMLRRITESKNIVEFRITTMLKLMMEARNSVIQHMTGCTDKIKVKLDKHGMKYPDSLESPKVMERLCEWLIESNNKLANNVEEII